MGCRARPLRWSPILALLAALGLVGCAPMAPAPVEDRATRQPSPPPVQTVAPATYEVRRGDTLYSIAFRYRLDWRDVASWNGIGEPYLIRPGQELRLRPPPQALARRDPGPDRRTRDPVPSPAPLPQPVPDPPPQSEPEPATRPAPEVRPEAEPAPAESAPATRAPAPAASTRRASGVEWRWPTEGRVVRPFDAAATRRGIGIGGSSGQPVFAAAEGRVVYSGTALIGYGELIIIKHSETMLSAYAHNRVRLVEEGVQVRSGQQIAEMGVSDRNEELLHFEIRRNGQPENPLDFLPPR